MMKKTTQKSLSKRLAQYGALTVAVAGIADVNGQIVYTDLNPDFNGGSNTDYALDLNNDGTVDFQLTQVDSSTTSVGFQINFKSFLIAPTGATNDVLGDGASSSGSFAYPFALNSGAIISNGQAQWNNTGFSSGYSILNANVVIDLGGTNYSLSAGNFINVTDKFVGLRFDLSGETYYGWARLDVNTDGTNWVIKDYAYNSTPDQPINAGQTTLGINEQTFNAIKVVALNKSIGLYNLPEATNYTLISVSGQSVLKGATTGHSYVIEANSIANGIYVLELVDTNTNAIVRKKITI